MVSENSFRERERPEYVMAHSLAHACPARGSRRRAKMPDQPYLNVSDLLKLPDLPPGVEYANPSEKRWAQEHLRFLQESNLAVLDGLKRSGNLSSYLSSVGESADQSFMEQMNRFRHRPELRNLPHLELIQALQNHLQSVEEQVRHDLILQPVPQEAEEPPEP
jgi:hypothetical protein